MLAISALAATDKSASGQLIKNRAEIFDLTNRGRRTAIVTRDPKLRTNLGTWSVRSKIVEWLASIGPKITSSKIVKTVQGTVQSRNTVRPNIQIALKKKLESIDLIAAGISATIVIARSLKLMNEPKKKLGFSIPHQIAARAAIAGAAMRLRN